MSASPAPPNPRPPRLDALTPLRFVAAAAIAGVHGLHEFGLTAPPGVLYAANAGVSFFFVLSGFVLAYNYPVLADRSAVRDFLVLRFARIWPLHFVMLAHIVIAFPRSSWAPPGIDPWIAMATSATLTHAWIPISGVIAAYNGPSWTLSVDLFFYLMFPMLIVRVREAPWRTFAGTLLVSLACPMLANALGAPAQPSLDQWNWYLLDHTFPLARLAEFALGAAVACAFVPTARAGGPPGSRATLAEAALLALAVFAATRLDRAPLLAAWFGIGVGDWLAQVGAAPFFAALVVVIARGRGALSRLLGHRIAVHLGDLAFATYLLHVPLLRLAIWRELAERHGPALSMTVFWLVVLALAHIAWRWIEVPARRAIVRAGFRKASTPP